VFVGQPGRWGGEGVLARRRREQLIVAVESQRRAVKRDQAWGARARHHRHPSKQRNRQHNRRTRGTSDGSLRAARSSVTKAKTVSTHLCITIRWTADAAETARGTPDPVGPLGADRESLRTRAVGASTEPSSVADGATDPIAPRWVRVLSRPVASQSTMLARRCSHASCIPFGQRRMATTTLRSLDRTPIPNRRFAY
jgi:hypothetical protein